MILKNLDLNELSRLITSQLDHVTCIECCKCYIVPTTAKCGHTLCHSCWSGRRNCPYCTSNIDKRTLNLNLPLQSLTGHVSSLLESFEDLFNIKLDEYLLDFPANENTEIDPNKNVKEWLASSQNHFSAPITNSQQSTQEHHNVKQVTGPIQVHSESKKNVSSVEVVHIPPHQDDWDKIEEMPDSENVINKNNIIGPMDIEPFDFMLDDNDKEHSTEKPRRSSRNKELKSNNPNLNSDEINKTSDKGSNIDSEKRSHNVVKQWSTVKRMKKEFSKLNKKNKNKLNVSIEMVKKTQMASNKATTLISQPALYNIDDSTPTTATHTNKDHILNNIDIIQEVDQNQIITDSITTYKNPLNKNNIEVYTEKGNQQEIYLNKSPINKNYTNNKICFFKKGPLQPKILDSSNIMFETNDDHKTFNTNTDDIEITIKIGNTLTNICIKKKENDVQLKINSDREIQTSLDNDNKQNVACSPINYNSKQNVNIDIDTNTGVTKNISLQCGTPKVQVSEKSMSTKKNTASADTATAQFEFSESIEKQISYIMDNLEHRNEPIKTKANSNSKICENVKENRHTNLTPKKLDSIPEDIEYLNDLDIFDGESVKEGNIQSLKASKNTASAILMPTIRSSHLNSPKPSEKRDREISDMDELPSNKKLKVTHANLKIVDDNESTKTSNMQLKDNMDQDSESINYDVIMSQVFKNIDADMNNFKSQNNQTLKTQVHIPSEKKKSNKSKGNNITNECSVNEKYSENIFSLLEKDEGDSEILKMSHCKTPRLTNASKKHPDDTSIICYDNKTQKKLESVKPMPQNNDIEIVELSTPVHDDDSDKSIVEETPQKCNSFTKNKASVSNMSKTKYTEDLTHLVHVRDSKKPPQDTQKNTGLVDDVNIINLSDTVGDSMRNSRNVTVVDTAKARQTLETPLTINKFVDQIQHKSTPLARKSLNFNSEIADDDPEQTLCPSSFIAAKTTQEQEFMRKAFEQTLNSSIQCTYNENNQKRVMKFCLAGSCLTSSEQASLKLLCTQRNWVYTDKYTEDLTHLVVGVDDENKSQRSVKYMCALAGAKWIVSFAWIEKCLKSKQILNEEPFEALDGTGEPGPRRSRLAKEKLFQGITFYCMPPFSVLDVETLKDILEAAGGVVVRHAKEVRASATPGLLLAEPENTQEDRFIYLAMELSIVPVNYEWVLNCLGSYTLGSIYELLLCPASLLPPITNKWPSALISRENE